jgi:hypothetical protein
VEIAAVRPLALYAGARGWRRRVASTGFAVAVAAVGVQTAAHLANAYLLQSRYPGLDAATEGNAFAWAASLATLAAAGGSLGIAVTAERGARLHGAALAVLIAFLAADDMADLHDVLASDVSADLPGRLGGLGAWAMPGVYLPVLLLAFALLVRSALAAAPAATRPLCIGIGLLTAAIAVRLVAAAVQLEGGTFPSAIRTAGEALQQGMELGGWILVATGLAASVGAVRNSDRPPTNRRRSPQPD